MDDITDLIIPCGYSCTVQYKHETGLMNALEVVQIQH